MASKFLTALDEFAARHQRLNQALAGFESRLSGRSPDAGASPEPLVREIQELRQVLARQESLLAQIAQNTAPDGDDALRFTS